MLVAALPCQSDSQPATAQKTDWRRGRKVVNLHRDLSPVLPPVTQSHHLPTLPAISTPLVGKFDEISTKFHY